jgi:cell division protein FtsL
MPGIDMKPILHVLNLPGRKPITIHVFDFGQRIVVEMHLQEKADDLQFEWMRSVVEQAVKPHHTRASYLLRKSN